MQNNVELIAVVGLCGDDGGCRQLPVVANLDRQKRLPHTRHGPHLSTDCLLSRRITESSRWHDISLVVAMQTVNDSVMHFLVGASLIHPSFRATTGHKFDKSSPPLQQQQPKRRYVRGLSVRLSLTIVDIVVSVR